MNNNKSPAANEMEKYLRIIDGNSERFVAIPVTEAVVDTNVYFGNIALGDRFIFEDGTQWIKILENKNNCWKIEHGFAGDVDGDSMLVEKAEVSTLLRDNKIYQEKNKTMIMTESNHAYETFLEKVDRYLYKNYQLEVTEMAVDWRTLFEGGYSPSNAAEYAML